MTRYCHGWSSPNHTHRTPLRRETSFPEHWHSATRRATRVSFFCPFLALLSLLPSSPQSHQPSFDGTCRSTYSGISVWHHRCGLSRAAVPLACARPCLPWRTDRIPNTTSGVLLPLPGHHFRRSGCRLRIRVLGHQFLRQRTQVAARKR